VNNYTKIFIKNIISLNQIKSVSNHHSVVFYYF